MLAPKSERRWAAKIRCHVAVIIEQAERTNNGVKLPRLLSRKRCVGWHRQRPCWFGPRVGIRRKLRYQRRDRLREGAGLVWSDALKRPSAWAGSGHRPAESSLCTSAYNVEHRSAARSMSRRGIRTIPLTQALLRTTSKRRGDTRHAQSSKAMSPSQGSRFTPEASTASSILPLRLLTPR